MYSQSNKPSLAVSTDRRLGRRASLTASGSTDAKSPTALQLASLVEKTAVIIHLSYAGHYPSTFSLPTSPTHPGLIVQPASLAQSTAESVIR